MQSIIDILHKNFNEDRINSSRFPGGFFKFQYVSRNCRHPIRLRYVLSCVKFALVIYNHGSKTVLITTIKEILLPNQ